MKPFIWAGALFVVACICLFLPIPFLPFLLWIASIAFLGIGFAGVWKQAEKKDTSKLGTQGRKMLRGINAQRDEIEAIVRSRQGDKAFTTLGQEILSQVEAITIHARNEIESTGIRPGANNSQRQMIQQKLAQLNTDLEAATDESEKEIIQRSIGNAESLLASYQDNTVRQRSLESRLMELEITLTDIKNQLRGGSPGESDELRSRLNQLKSLSQSYDEAEEFLNRP